MPTYSHSRLNTFETCKLQYKYKYVDHIRTEGQSVEAFLGSRVHEVFEKLYAELKFKVATLEELTKYYNDNWDKNWNDDVFIVRTDRTKEDYRTIGLKAIEDYYKRHHPFEEGRVLGVEKKMVFDLDESGNYRVQGVVDRLMEKENGHYEVHDYKTAGSIREQAEFDKDRQLALYEIAIRQKWNDVKKVDLVWHYVVFDKEFRSTRTPEQLEQIKNNTIALINEIETVKEFPPHKSTLCNWCDYQDICPLFSHKHKTDLLPTNEYLKEEGVSLVNKYASLEADKKELKDKTNEIEKEQNKIKEAAIAVAKKEGAEWLYGSENILRIKEDLKVSYPKTADKNRAEFVDQIKKLGLWDEITDVQWNSIKKIAKDQNWLQSIPESLKDFIIVETEKKVSLSKKKSED